MKKLSLILIVMLISLSSCKKINNDPDNDYLDPSILTEELNSYVSKVIDNEYLLIFINENYSKNKLSEDSFTEGLNNAKLALFNYEVKRLSNLYNLEVNYFKEISDINHLYPYVMINKGTEFVEEWYNFNLECLDNRYNIDLFNDEDYYMFNDSFNELSYDLLITKELINALEKVNNKYILYIITKSYNYKITLNEVNNNIPYIINPNVYSDFTSDAIIYIEALDGIVSLSDAKLDAESFTITNNSITINKDYLQDIFINNRKSFIFGIQIYLDNSYYLETIQIIDKSKN